MFLDDQSSFLVTVFLLLLHALLPMKTERFFSLVQVSFATLKNTATLILDMILVLSKAIAVTIQKLFLGLDISA